MDPNRFSNIFIRFLNEHNVIQNKQPQTGYGDKNTRNLAIRELIHTYTGEGYLEINQATASFLNTPHSQPKQKNGNSGNIEKFNCELFTVFLEWSKYFRQSINKQSNKELEAPKDKNKYMTLWRYGKKPVSGEKIPCWTSTSLYVNIALIFLDFTENETGKHIHEKDDCILYKIKVKADQIHNLLPIYAVSLDDEFEVLLPIGSCLTLKSGAKPQNITNKSKQTYPYSEYVFNCSDTIKTQYETELCTITGKYGGLGENPRVVPKNTTLKMIDRWRSEIPKPVKGGTIKHGKTILRKKYIKGGSPEFLLIMQPAYIISGKLKTVTPAQGSSVFYSSKDDYYKTIVKNEMPLPEMFKRCFNEMLAAYTYNNLFKLGTLQYTLMYYTNGNVFVLCSKINKNITTAEKNAGGRKNTEYYKKFTRLMSNEFLVDCIMCNWDAYCECNCLVINDTTLRVDVGGCLNYRAMGEERMFFKFKDSPNDHISILEYNAEIIKIDDEMITSNIALITDAFLRFEDFQVNAIIYFSKMLDNNMNLDVTVKEPLRTFIIESIGNIRARLLYYRDNGETILNTIVHDE